jgi:hypothetical protein
LADHKKWHTCISIEHPDINVTDRQFSVPVNDKTVFDTKEEAFNRVL